MSGGFRIHLLVLAPQPRVGRSPLARGTQLHDIPSASSQPMKTITIDEGTHRRLEVLARGLPVGDVVRSLGHASAEDLRRLDLRRVMREAAERERKTA